MKSAMADANLRDLYLGLPDRQKQIFLLIVSYELTIHGRSFGLDLVGEKQIQAFEGLNELQHQISQHVAGIAVGRDRYPDEAFWKILHETAESHGLSAHLTQSITFASSRKGFE